MHTSRFTLTPEFISEIKGTQPAWGPLGYFTNKKTNARPIEGTETTEQR